MNLSREDSSKKTGETEQRMKCGVLKKDSG